MIEERLIPTSFTGNNDNVSSSTEYVSHIQDPVDTPDSNYIVPSSDTAIMTVGVNMDVPTSNISGTQIFKALVRNVTISGFTSSGTEVGIDVYQNGFLIASKPIGIYLENIATLNVEESSFIDSSGSNITVEVHCRPYVKKSAFGTDIVRCDLGAVEWDAVISSITNPPIVTITNVTKHKISDEAGMDLSIVTFSFDRDIQSYRVMVGGVSHDTGILTHEYIGSIGTGVEVNAEIDSEELSTEGNNRINIYGQGMDGSWTQYEE